MEFKSKKSKSWLIWALFGIFSFAVIGTALTSQDLDEICDVEDSILFRYAELWGCATTNSSLFNITNNNYYFNETTSISTVNLLNGSYLWIFSYSNGTNYANFTTGNLTGQQGIQGVKGDTGDQGPIGPEGPAGNGTVQSGNIYITTNTELQITNISANISAFDSRYATLSYVNAINNLSQSFVQSLINANGNWSADKSSYNTTAELNTLYYPLNNIFGYYNISTLPAFPIYNNLSQAFVQSLINENGNWSADKSAIYSNITSLQTINNLFYTNITNLQISNTSAWTNIAELYNNLSLKSFGNVTTTGNFNYISLFSNSTNIENSIIYQNLPTINSFCYQESANTSNQTGIDGNCGLIYNGSYAITNGASNGFFYINYTKPLTASYEDNIWVIATGNITTPSQNITLPSTCFNGDKLQLRLYSTNTGSNASYGQCYNSSQWQNITPQINYATPASSSLGSCATLNSTNRLLDGNWSTGCYHTTNWFMNNVFSITAIREEAIWWNVFEYSTNPNVGVGTTMPLQKLDINGSIKIAGFNSTCDITTQGSIYYDTTTYKHYGCNSTSWNALYN